MATKTKMVTLTVAEAMRAPSPADKFGGRCLIEANKLGLAGCKIVNIRKEVTMVRPMRIFLDYEEPEKKDG